MATLPRKKITAEEIAETLAQLLESDIPGLEHYTLVKSSHVCLVLHYQCPCGEVSGIDCSVGRAEAYLGVWSSVEFVNHYIDRVKRMLRSHVRSEGNEPNF